MLPPEKSVSVVIPSYNGRGLLEENLPSLMRAVSAANVPVEVIVVDDGSSDDTFSFLEERFPTVRVLVNERNLGFIETMNRGIRASRNDLVLSLNNDILVGEDLFERTLSRFEDPAVFSVTPNVVDPRTQVNQAISMLAPGPCWFGITPLEVSDLPDLDGEWPLFYALGGASFYDREKLLRLGGFDPVFQPFYMEDIDLSYRAWKAGWKAVLEPRTTVWHKGSSTISGLHRRRKIKFYVDRNRTLLLWLNVTDPALIIRYFLCLPFSLMYDILAFRKYKFVGFFWALKYLPRIPVLRKARKELFTVSDREVIALVRRRRTRRRRNAHV